MGWSIGYDDTWKRDIGYGVPAYCDHPGCGEEIHRGLSHVCCGEQPYGGARGCGLYFCSKHQDLRGRCERCRKGRGSTSFQPTPDHPEWIAWKLTDESWQQWREQNPQEVALLTTDQNKGSGNG